MLRERTIAVKYRTILFLILMGVSSGVLSSVPQWSIPAQPLPQSLVDLSRFTHQSILYNPDIVKQKNAPAISSDLPLETALQILLQGTLLHAEKLEQGWVITLQSKDVPTISKVAVPDIEPIEEILITGYYSKNLQLALNRKKTSTELIDAIAAEDIEKFPAQNIAEALQHSSGVTVVRDRGEALFVSIRGLPTTFNKVTLNGYTLATNENVRNSGQYGRRFHFDTFPAELVAGVEVIKSASAEQDEGGISGTVNIRTFNPFDLEKNMLSLSTSLDESELAQTAKPRMTALASWLNAEKTLGVSLALSGAERSLRQDRALNFGWETLTITTPETGATNVITPLSFRPTLELENRMRQGGTLAIQWHPDDAFSLDTHIILLQQDIHYAEYSYGPTYSIEQLQSEYTVYRGNALVGGKTQKGSLQISQETSGVVDKNKGLDLAIKWQREKLTLTGGFSLSKAKSFNDEPIKRIRLNRLGDVEFSFYYPEINGHSVPELGFQNIDLTNPSDVLGRRLEWRVIDTDDSERAIHLSAKYAFDNGALDDIDVGIKVDDHRRDYHRKDAVITDNIAGKFFAADYFESFPVSHFLGDTNQRLPTLWLSPNVEKFWASIDESALYARNLSQSDLLNSYQIVEKSTAFYVKSNWSGDFAGYSWHGNIGARQVVTQQSSNGFSLMGDLATPQFFFNDRHYFLPSANLVVNVNRDVLLRLAVSRSMTRPDFQDLAPRLTLNSGESLTAVGGNPNLKPVNAEQLDSALEWYCGSACLLSGGVFYKKLHHFFQNETSNLMINNKNYTLSSIGNGASAYARGIELAYQQKLLFLPSPFNQLGVESNYTYTNSTAEYTNQQGSFYDDLADVAKHSVNLGGYVENEKWNLRVNYSWRDKVLNQVGTAALSAQNTAAFGSLDMHFSYVVNDKTQINVDGINLNNSAQQDFVANGEFANYTLYGRRYLLGVKWQVF